jgi:predicted RNA-binding protein
MDGSAIAFDVRFVHNGVAPEAGAAMGVSGCKRRNIMCDVNVFVRTNGVEEKVLENVDLIEETDAGMHLVNIFGEERTLRAKMVLYNNSEKRMIFQAL